MTANELTSVPYAIACSTPSEPSTAHPPTSTGSDAATSEPKMSSSRISTIGSDTASAKRQVLRSTGWTTRRPSGGAAGELGGGPLDRELVVDLPVRLELLAVVGAGQGEHGDGAASLSADAYCGGLVRPVRRDGRDRRRRQRGQPVLHPLAERGVVDAARRRRVDHDDVAALGAQLRRWTTVGGPGRLAARVVVAALGQLAEDAQPPHPGRGDRDERARSAPATGTGPPMIPRRRTPRSPLYPRPAPHGTPDLPARRRTGARQRSVAASSATPPQFWLNASSVTQLRLILPFFGARYVITKTAVSRLLVRSSNVEVADGRAGGELRGQLAAPGERPHVEPQGPRRRAGRGRDA